MSIVYLSLSIVIFADNYRLARINQLLLSAFLCIIRFLIIFNFVIFNLIFFNVGFVFNFCCLSINFSGKFIIRTSLFYCLVVFLFSAREGNAAALSWRRAEPLLLIYKFRIE